MARMLYETVACVQSRTARNPVSGVAAPAGAGKTGWRRPPGSVILRRNQKTSREDTRASRRLHFAALLFALPARAEKQEISIVGQYGISYLPVMLMEHEKVVEKRAREAGLGEVKVTWDANAGPAGANDLLLSGTRDISGVGLPSLGDALGGDQGQLERGEGDQRHAGDALLPDEPQPGR